MLYISIKQFSSSPTDGHSKDDIEYKWWRNPMCSSNCDEIYIYDKDMANFQILEARKTKEATMYHAGETSFK